MLCGRDRVDFPWTFSMACRSLIFHWRWLCHCSTATKSSCSLPGRWPNWHAPLSHCPTRPSISKAETHTKNEFIITLFIAIVVDCGRRVSVRQAKCIFITNFWISCTRSLGSNSQNRLRLAVLASAIISSGVPQPISGSVNETICSLVMSSIRSGNWSNFCVTTTKGFVLWLTRDCFLIILIWFRRYNWFNIKYMWKRML